MLIIPLIFWIVSCVLFAIKAALARPGWDLTALGLLAFDLWLGLHFLLESGERITFG
jgi:hypothetical protein